MKMEGKHPVDVPAADYEKDRMWNRIISFHKKGIENRNNYHRSQAIIIIAAALIPIINVLEIGSYEVRIASSILGGIVIGITSILGLKKYQENWILYRTTEEALRREFYLFKNNAGDYAELEGDEKKRRLVEKSEALLLSQTLYVVCQILRNGIYLFHRWILPRS